MLVKKLLSAILLTMGVCSSAAENVLPFLPVKPVIDGKVSAAEWRSAEKKMLKRIVRGTASDKTAVYFGRDKQNFYAAFICYDKNPAQLKSQWQTPEERDNSIWSDDCVELRFDPWNTAKESFIHRHIIVNSNGVVYDAVGRNPMPDFNLTVQSHIGKDFWSVELAIPLNELLGYLSNDVELWRFSLARHNPRNKEIYSLTGDQSSNLAHAGHFLTYRSDKIDPAKPFTIVGFQNSALVWRSEKPSQTLTGTLEQLSQDYRSSGSKAVSVLNSKNPQAKIVLKLDPKTRILRFNAPGNCKLEWSLSETGVRANPVKFTEKPLYKELWQWNLLSPGKNRRHCRRHTAINCCSMGR